MANTRARLNNIWRPVGAIFDGDPDPDPDPDPPVITHGEELPPTSLAAEEIIGARGVLTPMSGGLFEGTQVIENREITGQARIAAGARITFKNCRLIGDAGASGANYTVRCNDGGGAWVTLEDCTVICRAGAGGNEELSKAIAGFNDINIEIRRCVIRGGEDAVYFGGPDTPGKIPTDDPLVPMARLVIEESWLGDGETSATSHADLTQIHGGSSPKGYCVIRRSRYMAYDVPPGSDTLTTRVTDPSTASMTSACLIITYGSTGSGTHHLAIRDNWFEGGNWVVDTHPDSVGPIEVTGNRWGTRHRFGPLRGTRTANTDNRWGQTGMTDCCGQVTAGQLLSGSTE
jgi:hypothetical protein